MLNYSYSSASASIRRLSDALDDFDEFRVRRISSSNELIRSHVASIGEVRSPDLGPQIPYSNFKKTCPLGLRMTFKRRSILHLVMNTDFPSANRQVDEPTDQRIDGRTDRHTDRPFYEDVRTHLKIRKTPMSRRPSKIEIQIERE